MSEGISLVRSGPNSVGNEVGALVAIFFSASFRQAAFGCLKKPMPRIGIHLNSISRSALKGDEAQPYTNSLRIQDFCADLEQ